MEEEEDQTRNRKRRGTLCRPCSGRGEILSPVPVHHRRMDRHFPPAHRGLPTAEGNMIYRGQHHKQQHSLTNTQWQSRPHADTLPHHKSREVAGRGKKRGSEGERGREGWTESVADRERCRGRQEVMGERWRRISKCFLKYKQPSASVVVIVLSCLSLPSSLSPSLAALQAASASPINNG